MLETLRKSTGSLVVKILFGLLILSFGVWGIGDVVRGGGTVQPAVTVGDVEVGPGVVRQEFQRQVDRLRQVFGPDLTSDLARQMGVLEESIQQVVTTATLDMAARDVDIVVSEDALRAAVISEPAFHIGGRFSRDQFLRVLSANNLTEERFVESLASDLRRARMIQPVAANGTAPQVMAEALYRFRSEGRIAETLTIPAAALTLEAEATEDDLQELYESSLDRYQAPQYRGLTAVRLTTQDVMDRAEVDDQAIADHYAANSDLYVIAETRTVRQVIVQDADTANAISAAARDLGSLAEAAIASQAPAPIDLGAVTRDGLPATITEPVFALDAGEISDPVQSPLGWHVFEIEAAAPATEQPLDAVRDDIRQRIAAERSVDLLYTESAALEDALGGGASLEEAAEMLDLELFTVEAVDIDGRTPATEAAALPADDSDAIIATAFGLESGQESLLQETDNGYFVVRVNTITPAAPLPFSDVRDAVRADWEARQRQQQAEALAERLAEQARPPTRMEALADTVAGVTHARRPLVTRTGDVPDAADGRPLDRALIGPLFSLQPGETLWRSTERGAVVIRLAEVVPADPASNPDAIDTLRSELADGVADDVLVQMTTAFGSRFGVQVNRTVIDQMF